MPQADFKTIGVLLGLIAASFLVFGLWPGLDLAVTGWFYTPETGFLLQGNWAAEAFRRAVWGASILLLSVALPALISGLLAWRETCLGLSTRLWGGVVVLYLLGPGLLVDRLLKHHWGRARPANVIEFGGTARFTPPHEISGECARNCSFASGEVAGAAALSICLLVILWNLRSRLPEWLYRTSLAVTLILPVLIGFQRIAAGRHFLSDVILAVLLVALVAAVQSRLLPLRARGAVGTASRLAVVDIRRDSPY